MLAPSVRLARNQAEPLAEHRALHPVAVDRLLERDPRRFVQAEAQLRLVRQVGLDHRVFEAQRARLRVSAASVVGCTSGVKRTRSLGETVRLDVQIATGDVEGVVMLGVFEVARVAE